MKKNILLSSLFLTPGKVGGAENFLYNLTKGFKDNSVENIDILLNSNNKYEPENFLDYNLVMQEVKYNRAFNEMFLKNLDEYSATLMTNYVSPLKKFKNVTTVIHDLQYKHYPEFFTKKKRAWLHFSHLNTLKHANKVVAISDFVRDDIISRFGQKYANKIYTIYNPIDLKRFDKTREISLKDEYKIEKKFILSVAAHYPHKNIKTLILAFNEFCKTNDNYQLVLTGQLPSNLVGGDKTSNAKLLNDLVANNPNIIITGYVDNDVLGELYRNASLFVFPSLFEGFGMPPVEAMMMGLPTITTKHPAIFETTMGKALYVDNPTDYSELCTKIEFVLANLDDFISKIQETKGQLQHRYSLQNIAKQYEELMLK